MSRRRIWEVMRKDLLLGPRSPLLMWAIAMPLVMTFVVTAVFGGLFDPEPRLGIVDMGDSVILAAAADREGIAVSALDSATDLRNGVERHDFDAGWVIPAGFDAAVTGGERPVLEFFVSGESLASDRVVLSATAMDLVRQVAGSTAPVTVDLEVLGDPDAVPLVDRLLSLLVIMAVAIAGTFVPAATLVQEKEQGTIDAVLVTPTTLGEFLAGKAGFGWVLALTVGIITLAINRAFGTEPLLLVGFLAIGAVMMVEIGLILGAWAKDANTMFTAWKSGGIILFLPVIFSIWPNLPQWIAKLAPTYYFLDPISDLALFGGGWADVWVDGVIALAVCAALIPLVALVGRRLEHRLGAEA